MNFPTFNKAYYGHLSIQSNKQQLTKLGKFLIFDLNCCPIGDKVKQTCKLAKTLFKNT